MNFSPPAQHVHDGKPRDPTESFTKADLSCEAEGLFAGVTLLEEVEPVWEPTTRKWNDWFRVDDCAELACKFLHSLRPSKLGDGIRCVLGAHRGYGGLCDRSTSCTADGIRKHFMNCVLAYHMDIPRDVALSAIVDNPNIVAHLLALQWQCQIIRENPISTPSIDDFLGTLAYSTNAHSVICPHPGCPDNVQFGPEDLRRTKSEEASPLQLHFRRFHCSNFDGAYDSDMMRFLDGSIQAQCSRPATQATLDEMSARLSRARADDTYAVLLANGFFGRPTDDRQQTPALVQQAILDERAQQNSTRTWARRSTSSNDSSDQLLGSTNTELRMPRWEQLRVLRSLRARFILHHRRFLQLTAASDDSDVSGLAERLKSYRPLLQTGLLTLRAVLNGEKLFSLDELLGFVGLTFAMAETMKAKGKNVDFCQDSLEMLGWQACLRSDAEMNTFGEVIHLMWPQLATFLRHDLYRDILDFSLRDCANELLQVSSTDNDFRFSDWLYAMDSEPSSQLENMLNGESQREILPTEPSDTDTVSNQGSHLGVPDGRNSLTQTALCLLAIKFLLCE